MVRFEPPAQQQQLPEALVGPAQRNRRATMAELLRSSQPQALTSNSQGAAVLAMGAAGGLIDGIAARQEQTAAQERAKATALALTGAVGGMLPQGITREQFLGLALANPKAATKIAQNALEARFKPQERFEPYQSPDGRKGQRSTLTGKVELFPDGPGPITAGPGQVLFGRDGRQIAAVPEKPPAPVSVPEGGRLVDPRTGQQVYQAPPGAPRVEKIQQADGSQVATQWDPDKRAWVPMAAPDGGNAVGAKPTNPFALPGKPTEEQGKAAGFATRMVQGHNIMNNLDAAAIDGWEALKARSPAGSNFIISDEKQRLLQAQRNFVNAILRRESGAVIGQEEFDNATLQYFPQPGDSPAVIAQKRANREVAIEGVMGAAGSGYKVPEEYRPTRQQQAGPPPQQPGQAPPASQPQAGAPAAQVPSNMPDLAAAIDAEIERKRQLLLQQQQQAQPQQQIAPSILPPMP